MKEVDLSVWNSIRPKLMTRIRNQVRDAAIAADLVQDVYLHAHAHVGSLRDPDRLVQWLFRIAQNRVMDYFRDLKRLVNTPTDSEEEYNAYNDCVASCLEEEINQLPMDYKEAIVGADVQALSQVDLAARSKVSYSGLKSRVQRARRMVRERLLEKYLIESDAYGNILRCEQNPDWKGVRTCGVKG